MGRGLVGTIIRGLKSRDKDEAGRAIRMIGELVDGEGDERLLKKLMKGLLRLCMSGDWETRRAGMLGLRELAYSKAVMKHVKMVMPTILRGLTDEDGRVRWASVQALDRYRTSLYFPKELYLKVFFELKNMYLKSSGNVKRSIGQALDRMDCPYLRMLLRAKRLADKGLLNDDVLKILHLEALRESFELLIDDMRRKALKRRMRRGL